MEVRPEVAGVLRAHWKEFLASGASVTFEQHRVVRDLLACQTPLLGGHLYRCAACSAEVPLYNSCRNRHCPKCQGYKAAEWVRQRQGELLSVQYFHTVFTLPHVFNPLVQLNPQLMYDLLFKAVSRTLLQVGRKNLGCQLGFFALLHTWGQNLSLHPHLHLLITGCGLSPDGQSVTHFKQRYFVADRILTLVFRGKFIQYLKKAYRQGKLRLPDECRFDTLVTQAISCRWVVHTKPPFGGPEVVLKYLARYTHRVAISNRRLVSLDDAGNVTFGYKDYRDGQQKQLALTAVEFIRRFLQHVLPKAFVRVRYFGFLASSNRRAALARLRQLLSASEPEKPALKLHSIRCPHCNADSLVLVSEILPRSAARGPGPPYPNPSLSAILPELAAA